jgi:hypothetical protein
MRQQWILQGRGSWEDAEWIDLYSAPRIKALPRVNQRMARAIGATYRVVMG